MKKTAVFIVIFSISALYGQNQERKLAFVAQEVPLTQPAAGPAEDIARQFLAAKASDLALMPDDLPGVFLAKEYQTDHNGVTHLVFRQRFQGIEVWNAEWVTNVDRNGAVLSAGGTLYSNPGPAAALAAASSLATVRSAASAVNPALGARYAPLQSTRPARRPDAIAFAAGDFGDDVEGRLVWYGLRGALRLAWVFTVADADTVNRYSVVVEESSGAILEKSELTFFDTPPAGLVFDKGSPQPNPTPGIRLSSAPPLVDRVMMPLVGDLTASPRGWVTANSTAGNNTITGENRLGQAFIRNPQITSVADANFSFPFTAGPSPLLFADAVNVNLFYWINRAHDLHYQYGFNEAAGNFQQDNLGRGGVGGDPMLAYTHYGAAAPVGPSLSNAFFTSFSADDGATSQVAMFASLSGAGGFFTDGALDAEVIVHEYTHGVSTRLVRQGYSTFQGRSMGEAWSDFYSLEYTLPNGVPPDGIYPSGQYFIQAWGVGIRSHPYSTSVDVNPLTYADLGNVNFTGPEVHADGEIWVEALMEIRANLIAQFGEAEGRRRARLLVMDGMKLSVPAPSMVDMRDAILLADRADFDGASQSQLWRGFAKRGLGVLAYSSGADTVHVAPSFDTPSSTARLKFYDDSIVIGEPIRVLLADSNYTQPTVRIQLTSGLGDLEDVVLARTGSIYAGTIPTSRNIVNRQNGTLNIGTFDFVTAFYVDFATEAGDAKLVTANLTTQSPYSAVVQPLTAGTPTEVRLTNSANTRIILDLPFAFPFYAKKYKTAQVYSNGLIAFDVPVSSACTDGTALARYVAVAPFWTSLTFGSAQANEGLFLSATAPGSVTLRWAAETPLGSPVNFSATLRDDGAVDLIYANSSGNPALAPAPAGCGSGPAVGVSNGHDLFAQTVTLPQASNFTFRWDPPFNYSTVPQVKLESPSDGATVQGVLTVSGIVYDTESLITRVDVYIDNVERALIFPQVARPDFCSQQNVRGCPLVGFQTSLDLSTLGLEPGAHVLRVRATNTRAGFSDTAPVSFNMSPGPGRLPKGAIEFPAAGAELSGSVVFSGYAYFDDPALSVRRVDVLIDGVTYPVALYGGARTDICNPLPAPKPLNCPGVGWNLAYNTRTGLPPLPDGPHSMQIRVMDDSGRFTPLPGTVAFTVKNGPQQAPTGAISSPQPNAHLKGTVIISGYAYSPVGTVTSVLLLVDGFALRTAAYGIARPDVCASLPDVAACPNIGFSVLLDTTTLSNGPHVIGARIGNSSGLSVIVPALDSAGMNVFVDNP